MPSLRHQKVRELLKRTIGEILRRELPMTEIGLVTVNDVGVSADLHSASVFVGVLGSPAQKKRAVEVLDAERARLQYLLGHSVTLKYTPHIRFIVDDSIEKGNRVLDIIDELEHPDGKA
jgi:ribosome-binding factor A